MVRHAPGAGDGSAITISLTKDIRRGPRAEEATVLATQDGATAPVSGRAATVTEGCAWTEVDSRGGDRARRRRRGGSGASGRSRGRVSRIVQDVQRDRR